MFESSNIIIFLLVILIIIYFIKKHYEVKQVETFYNMLNSNVYERIGCGSQNGIFTRLKDNKKINIGNKKTKQCSVKEIIKQTNKSEKIEPKEPKKIKKKDTFYIQFLRKLNKIL